MYSFISGIVDNMEQDIVVIDCHGVGYELFTTPATMQTIAVGKQAKLYTQLIVREDALTFYGFAHKEDKEMFKRLISVSGIGPKLALALLSALSAPQVAMAIITADEKSLIRVPGLGKKTAQRLILELKGKLQTAHVSLSNDALSSASSGDVVDEAIDILTAMGFAPPDSAAAVALVRAEGGTPEQMAMSALRRLDRN